MERLGEPYGQKEWGARVALDFFLGGAGSSLVAFYLLNLSAFGESYETGLGVSVLSAAFIVCGFALLASELGRPSNLWRSMSKFRRSWMSRGAAFTSALVVGLVLLAATFALHESPTFASPLYLVVVLLSLAVSLYPGMLLHSVRDIRSWRSAVQPMLTFVEAASGGLGLLVLVSLVSRPLFLTAVFEALLASVLSLALSLAFLGSLALSGYPGARATYSELTSFQSRISFYPFLTFGCVVPVCCFLPVLLIQNWAWALPVAVVGTFSSLGGNIIYRSLLLVSARHEPLTLLGNRVASSPHLRGQDATHTMPQPGPQCPVS